MRARHLLLTGLAALAGLCLAACGPAEPSGYHGALYFGKGPYLMRFSLSDGSLSVVDNLGDKTIREVSRFGRDRLLIAETALVNRRTVARISWIDPETGESSALYSGVVGRYLDEAGVVVYDDGSKLYAVPQLGPGSTEVILPHRSNELNRMIEVSGSTLLFETGEAGARVISAWHAMTGELRELDALSAVCELYGAVWIGSLQRLACSKRAEAGVDAAYVLVDLDGVIHGQLDLPEGRQFHALTYVDSQQVLVLRETWYAWLGNQQRSAVWLHDISSGASLRLARQQNLGDSVVYVEF